MKEGTSAVLLQSGLDEKWWADSMECYCHLRNIQDLLSDGKTPYEQRFTSSVRNFHLEYSSNMSCKRGESGKETFWSQTLKNWRRWTHQNSTPRRLNAKEVITHQKGEKYITPVAHGKVKTISMRLCSENIHLNTGQP